MSESRKIEDIPEWELRGDLMDAHRDLGYARLAKAQGIERYSGGTVADRISGNERVISVIEAELKRRGLEP